VSRPQPPLSIKCHYCDWRRQRFIAGKYQGQALSYHVMAAHQDAFLSRMGCTTLTEYLHRQDAEDEELEEMQRYA
jgi:hypothetical protein